jgi:hypothetical protein
LLFFFALTHWDIKIKTCICSRDRRMTRSFLIGLQQRAPRQSTAGLKKWKKF